jgi:hypothetical protein
LAIQDAALEKLAKQLNVDLSEIRAKALPDAHAPASDKA